MFINTILKEINCKIVYYGVPLSGKRTNLEYLHRIISPNCKNRLIDLKTELDERVLFFDFLPNQIKSYSINGINIRFHLYTAPGVIFYNEVWKKIFNGASGIVFVADSQSERIYSNQKHLDDLNSYLTVNNLDINTIPYVLQLNKCDLSNISSINKIRGLLSIKNKPVVEAESYRGKGVIETFCSIADQIIANLLKGGLEIIPK